MTRESRRELAAALDDLGETAGETAAQDYVDELLAGGWDLVDDDPPNDDEMIQVLDCDGWQMTVPRDELPSGIDVETLPVTSV